MLQHAVAPPISKPGEAQRRPDELPDIMKYTVVREPKDQQPHTVKVILLEDIEGSSLRSTLSPLFLVLFRCGQSIRCHGIRSYVCQR